MCLTQSFIFWAWKKKSPVKILLKFWILGVKTKSTREKRWKTPKKYPWKSFFARENFRKFTPVKMKFVRVKKIKNSAREKSKSARENCHSFFLMVFLPKIFLLRIQFSAFLLRYWQKTWNLGWHTWNSITKFETFRVTRWAAEPLLCTSRSASSSAPAPWYSRALKGFQLFVFQLLWNHPSFEVCWPKLS